MTRVGSEGGMDVGENEGRDDVVSTASICGTSIFARYTAPMSALFVYRAARRGWCNRSEDELD